MYAARLNPYAPQPINAISKLIFQIFPFINSNASNHVEYLTFSSAADWMAFKVLNSNSGRTLLSVNKYSLFLYCLIIVSSNG